MRRTFSFIILFVTFICAIAQSPQFYGGLKLGMTQTEVKTILSKKSQSFNTDNKNGEIRYIITNPTIGGVTFQRLTLLFSQNKLIEANFVSNDAAGGMPGGPRFSQVSRSAKNYQSVFNNLYTSLQSKYGQPTTYDNNECTWTYHGTIIKLNYSYIDEMDGPYMQVAYAQNVLKYEKPNSSDL